MRLRPDGQGNAAGAERAVLPGHGHAGPVEDALVHVVHVGEAVVDELRAGFPGAVAGAAVGEHRGVAVESFELRGQRVEAVVADVQR